MHEQLSNVALVAAASSLQASRCFQLSAFVMLAYDHLITFDDEIERIWKQAWHFPTLLFFLNRYVTPLQRIVIVVAFNDPKWPFESCKHFAPYEGGGTMVLVTVAEVVMILRVYAMFQRKRWILYVLLAALMAQICITAVALSGGQAQILPEPLHACILVGRTPFFVAQWASTLGTDSLIFIFTLYKVYQTRKANLHIPLLDICIRDGILYFSVIFAANLLNTVLYTVASPGIKAIGASFSQLLTSTMISRLQLNLRGVKHRDLARTIESPSSPTRCTQPATREGITITDLHTSRLLGNLQADVELSSYTFKLEEDTSWLDKNGHHLGDEAPPSARSILNSLPKLPR